MSSLLIDNFLGGLNVRDSPNELTIYEATNMNNLTMDEAGGLVQRPGCLTKVALPGTGNKKGYPFYSKALDQFLCVRESGGVMKLFSRPGDLSGSWTDRGQVSTTLTARAAFIDWPGATPYVVLVLANDPDSGGGTVGGVYTYDGSSNANQRSSTIGGACIALWQNRVWVGGFPLSNADGNRARIFYSGRGDPTVWNTTTNFIDVRAKDGQPITALAVAAGSLVSFKRDSTYRHKDPETGDYDIIDPGIGCVNPQAVASLRGRLYVWAAEGVYECDGVSPLENVGDRLRPWYVSSLTDPATIVAATYQDRVLFNGTILGIGRTVELNPDAGWAVPHIIGNSVLLSGFTKKGSVVYAAAPAGDDLLSIFTETGQGDDSANQDIYWQSAWLLPTSGMFARLNRIDVHGLITDVNKSTVVLAQKDWDETDTLGGYQVQTQLALTASEVNRVAVVNQPAKGTATGAVGQGRAFQVAVSASGPGNAKIRAIQVIAESLADRSLKHVRYPGGQTTPPPRPGGDRNRPPPVPPRNPAPPAQ